MHEVSFWGDENVNCGDDSILSVTIPNPQKTHWTAHKSCTCYCWPASPAKFVLIICINHIVYIYYMPVKVLTRREREKTTTTKPTQPVWHECLKFQNSLFWNTVETLVSGASSGSFGCTAESSPAHFREYSRKTDYQREVVGRDGLACSWGFCLSSPARF